MIALAIAGGLVALFLIFYAICLAAIAGDSDRRLEQADRADRDARDALDAMGDEVDAVVLDFRPHRTSGGWRL
jgi:hypothetical protein